MTTSLERGCDCLGEIRYLDAVVHDSRGEPRTIRNAVCIHEEDDGILWKHVDERTGAAGPAGPAAGDLLPRHRRQLRVPGLLALLPGRQHRVRGARDRDHGHLVLPARPAAAHRRAGRPAHLRALPPALHRGPAGPGHRRPSPTRSSPSSRGHCPSATPTRTGWRWSTEETPLRTESDGRQDYDWQVAAHAGRWRRQVGRNGLGEAPGLQADPRRQLPADDGRRPRRPSSGPK